MSSAPVLPDVPVPTEDLRYVIRQPNQMPPGGWSYRQRDTGRTWKEYESLDVLAQEVTAHRRTNRLPEGDPHSEIMHFTGARLVDEGFASLVEIHQPVHRTVADYWRGANAWAAISRMERQGLPVFVSKALAEERAAVCANCPKNVKNTASSSVQRITNDRMRKLIGGRCTSRDDVLGTCAVCSCEAALPIHFTADVLIAVNLRQNISKYPANCWKHNVSTP